MVNLSSEELANLPKEQVVEVFHQKASHFGTPLVVCQVGSHAYGLNIESSDEDYRGVFTPNIPFVLGLNRVEQIQIKNEDWVCQEVRHFINIVIKQNPTILELLFIENPIYETADWKPLREELRKLITKEAFKRYNAYFLSQLRKAQTREFIGSRLENVNKYGYESKFFSHVARLAVQCIFLMREGRIPVLVPEPYRSQIISIKQGKPTKEEVLTYCHDLDKLMHSAYLGTPLPDNHNLPKFERDVLIPFMERVISRQQLTV